MLVRDETVALQRWGDVLAALGRGFPSWACQSENNLTAISMGMPTMNPMVPMIGNAADTTNTPASTENGSLSRCRNVFSSLPHGAAEPTRCRTAIRSIHHMGLNSTGGSDGAS